jgi:hypothetical protein
MCECGQSILLASWDVSFSNEDDVTAYLYFDTQNKGMYTLTISGTGNMATWVTHYDAYKEAKAQELGKILTILDTLEVKDPYEQCVQYDSIKAGIQAHAETYSFNIESLLFNQLTKEQQKLWRKEIEQAVISGGEMGVELARDPRYKENLEVKEEDNMTANGYVKYPSKEFL